MKTPFAFALAVCLCSTLVSDLRADFLIYKVPVNGPVGGGGGSGRGTILEAGDEPGPGARPPASRGRGAGTSRRGTPPAAPTGGTSNELRIVLTGRVQVNPGRTVSYFHPSVKEPLYFSLDDVEHIKATTPQQEFNRRAAASSKDADAMMKTALWGLKKGLLREFYQGVDKALAIDPKHEDALRVKELKKRIDQPCPNNPALEQDLRSYVKSSGMQVATSNHFILLHDTAGKAAPGRRKSRAQERLDLLEEVYESFLLLFHAQDIVLDIPRDRMKVVLFNEYDDFENFATSLHPTLTSASGFWEPIRNVSVFYDHASDSTFEALEKIQEENKKKAEEAKRTRSNPSLVRFVKTLDLLIDVARENADITVVSHEATHQMAGNTGLLPRQVEIPRWVHEGLATYFESPGDAAWAGIGAVSEQRLEYYRALENDRAHSNIDFIVADQIFDYARSHGALLHGYGQAWALTHFLIENHLKELVGFYRMLGEMPPDVPLNPSLLTDVFNQVFGSDHKALDQEWRQYMKSLKTDQERLEETGSKRGT